MALTGLALGVPCAPIGARLTGGLLYGVTPSDPGTLAAAAGLFAIVGLLACLLLARRASTIDPRQALRRE